MIDKGIKVVVATLGGKGSLLVTKDLCELIPSIKVVDKTVLAMLLQEHFLLL
ncbi:MAG: hypothetical protein NC917_03470 [Candidatus Omnitrophica bacterium]|nr:hypothetical protein [Candidatus Omnitrophota bacterium]